MAEPFVKAPLDIVTLVCDFTKEMQAGEVIVTVDSFVITPEGITILGTPDHDAAGLKVEGEVSAGVADTYYDLVVTVTTDKGAPTSHQYVRTWKLFVRDL